MKKKKIIVVICLLNLLASCLTVFAAFTFEKTIIGLSNSGRILITENNFLEYTRNYTAVPLSSSYNSSLTYYVYNAKAETYVPVVDMDSTKYAALVGSLFSYQSETSAPTGESTGSLNCYGNLRKGFSEENSDYPYLNQVGFKFNFKSSLDVYLRIEFKDAWKSHKTYITTNTVDERFIQKDKIGGASPFEYSTDTDWIFDAHNNCAYYKYVIPKTCTNIRDPLAETSSDYVFRVNPNYWYTENTNSSFREMIIIELSFTINIVQANRAEKKWDIHFENLGIERTTKPVV